MCETDEARRWAVERRVLVDESMLLLLVVVLIPRTRLIQSYCWDLGRKPLKIRSIQSYCWDLSRIDEVKKLLT